MVSSIGLIREGRGDNIAQSLAVNDLISTRNAAVGCETHEGKIVI